MANELYRPLIEDMTWSYSRITCYESCPYAWFLKYIHRLKEEPNFYSSYGSFMHKLLEEYYKGKVSGAELKRKFLLGFRDAVQGEKPAEKTVKSYIESGVRYFDNFKPFGFEILAVEKRVDFKVCDKSFVGYVDLVARDVEKLLIIDHKSRNLKKPKRKTKNSASQAEIDNYLRQLYLYCIPIAEEYGKYPDGLCFNCFRSGDFIEEPFDIAKFEGAKRWALDEIEYIEKAEDFDPKIDWFFCHNLCGYKSECPYFDLSF